MLIRPATPDDDDALWAMLEPLLRAGEVFARPRDWSRAEGLGYWRHAGHVVQVAESAGEVVGSYYLHANQLGGGGHVANAGYMTRQDATGRGIARAMCVHSLRLAAELGYLAMQFNFVVASNVRAVALWRSCGFEVVGVLPGAFRHPGLGYVDALVMYRAL